MMSRDRYGWWGKLQNLCALLFGTSCSNQSTSWFEHQKPWKTDDIQLKLQGTSMRVSESQIYIKTSIIEMETNWSTMMYQTTWKPSWPSFATSSWQRKPPVLMCRCRCHGIWWWWWPYWRLYRVIILTVQYQNEKKANQPTRDSLRRRISWNNSSGWLVGICHCGTEQGGPVKKITLYLIMMMKML